MNQSFVIKMLKAKKMEYEAIKELMPEEMREIWEVAESQAKRTMKEIIMEGLKESIKENGNSKDDAKQTPKTKKVKVEF